MCKGAKGRDQVHKDKDKEKEKEKQKKGKDSYV